MKLKKSNGLKNKAYHHVFIIIFVSSGFSLMLNPTVISFNVVEWRYQESAGESTYRYIEAVSDHDVIVAGYVDHGSGQDLVAKRLSLENNQFVTKWTYLYNGDANLYDYGNCIRKVDEHLYLVVGVANSDELSVDAKGDVLAVLLRESEDETSVSVVWEFLYSEGLSGAMFVEPLAPNQYLLCGQRIGVGTTKAHAMLMKLVDDPDHHGPSLSDENSWSNIYWPDDATKDEYVSWFSCVRKTIVDGDIQFVGVGGSYRNMGQDGQRYGCIYLAWIDENGEVVQQNIAGELKAKQFLLTDPDMNGDKSYEGRYLSSEIDNGFVVTGFTVTEPDGTNAMNAYLLRIPKDWYLGSPSSDFWYREYGDMFITQQYNDFGWSVKGSTCNGEVSYLMSGYTCVAHTIHGSRDLWLLRVDSQGDVIWTDHYGTTGIDCGYSVDILSSGAIVAAGFYTDEDTNSNDLYALSVQGCFECEEQERDTIPPVVTFIEPAAGSRLSGDVELVVGVTDNVEVSKVEFSINTIVISIDSQAPYTCTWDTTMVGNGPVVVTATAYDSSDNLRSLELPVEVCNEASGMLETRLFQDIVHRPVPVILFTRFTNTGPAGTFRLSVDVLSQSGDILRVDARVAEVVLDTGEQITYFRLLFFTFFIAGNTYILRVQADDVYGNLLDEKNNMVTIV